MNVRFERFGNSWPPRKPPSTQQFTEQEKIKLKDALDAATECSRLAVAASEKDFKGSEKLLNFFFARPGDLARVKAGLKKMNDVLIDTNRTITFVDARGQSEKLLRFCERAIPGVPGRHGAVEQVLQSERLLPMTAGDYAYVKTTKNEDTASTEAHFGSGMRVYIGERGFHPSKTIRDAADTIYHELDHKVLGTTDHAYGVVDCMALANTDQAVQCAASWSLFVTSYMWTWPGLDWDPKEMIVTRSRSNAISKPNPKGPPPIIGRARSNAVSGTPPFKQG